MCIVQLKILIIVTKCALTIYVLTNKIDEVIVQLCMLLKWIRRKNIHLDNKEMRDACGKARQM